MASEWTLINVTFTKTVDIKDIVEIIRAARTMEIPEDIIEKLRKDTNVRDVLPMTLHDLPKKIIAGRIMFSYRYGFDMKTFRTEMSNLADINKWEVKYTITIE